MAPPDEVGVPAREATRAAADLDVGAMPMLAFVSACGVVIVAVSDALARSGRSFSEPLFWLGLLTIFVPIFARLSATEPRRGERVGLLLLLGGSLYIVKVLRDPFGFTYADELVHQANVLATIESRSLFNDNPILPVTPSFPGLSTVTAALASTTGLSTFASGLVVMAVARVILVLSLFLLCEVLTGSARVASVATAIYAVSPHFVFFTAQFAYESLALPLALTAVFAVARARSLDDFARRGWGAVAVMAVFGVVITHHVTAYALAALLVAACLVPMWWRRVPRPWAFAATAVVAAAAWLALVARDTIGYLSPVLSDAVRSSFRTAAGDLPSRVLFRASTGERAPAWERAVAIGSTLVIVTAIAAGLLVLWRRHRDNPISLVLGAAAAVYVATLPLRLVPAAWETAVRASDFLFVGVALVAGVAVVEVVDRTGRSLARRSLVYVAAGLVLVGGVVAGAARSERLAQTYRVATSSGDVDPAGVAVARWARAVLGRDTRIAAQEADARLLLAHGRQHVFAGTDPPFKSVLVTPALYRWQTDLLRREGIRYVVVDALVASGNVATGYFFPRDADDPVERFPRAVLTKFERAGARRIYDSGDITVFDVSGVREGAGVP